MVAVVEVVEVELVVEVVPVVLVVEEVVVLTFRVHMITMIREGSGPSLSTSRLSLAPILKPPMVDHGVVWVRGVRFTSRGPAGTV